ncbi:unnamed protein product [Paramecium sonneborni]|uniref:Uncharacterized protein n=1 Tax=Paramecium sonneborni TaxID=65129 RepID=A0A8S1PXB2_9CILI|nr:unnamed protein product [Paramecium sonneborni]
MKSIVAITLVLCLLSNQVLSKKHNQEEEHSAFEKSHKKLALSDDPAYGKLEEIQDHPLGSKILQTIALQLRGNESLSAVSKLLNDLKGDLEGKQIDADNERAQIGSQCKKDLQNYSQRISLSINEIKDAEFKAKRLNEAIAVYQAEINEKARQIKVFQAKDDTLRDIRRQDNLDFSTRTTQMKEMVQAFEVILPKLHQVWDVAAAHKAGSFIEEEAINEALVQLAKIGEENPITAMVALTSTLEPTAVQTLIEKMEAIRDSIKESIQAEEEAEAKNARDTDTILAAIFNAIESLTREKASDEEALQETIRNRDIQDKRSRDAHAEFNAAKNGNQQRNQQCQEYELQYQQNTIERDKQIAIIKDVQNIIATKIEVVTCFVEENNLF